MDLELQPEFSRFFTRKWTLSVPTRPSFKMFRATPSHFQVWVPLVTNPANNELQDTKDNIWDSAAIEDWKRKAEKQYAEANIKFNVLEVLVELDGKVMGYGDIYTIREGVASIGIILDKSARGLGLGKLAVGALAQICFDYGIRPVVGTMKANIPMRRVMAGLGATEKESITVLPGRGVVAEVDFVFDAESWKKVNMSVEFDDTLKRTNSVELDSDLDPAMESTLDIVSR